MTGSPRRAVWLLFVLPALALACGVPISAEEVRATAESGGIDITTTVEEAAGGSGMSGSAALDRALAAPAETVVPAEGASNLAAETTPTTTPDPDATPTATPDPEATATPTAVVSSAELANQATESVNQVRARSGRAELQVNAALAAAAAQYARNMAENNFFAHDGLDGSTPAGRLGAAGYAGLFRGEALAAGQSSGQSVVTTWLNSPAHAAIVLDETAQEIGIGHFYRPGSFYGHYWVLVVGAP